MDKVKDDGQAMFFIEVIDRLPELFPQLVISRFVAPGDWGDEPKEATRKPDRIPFFTYLAPSQGVAAAISCDPH